MMTTVEISMYPFQENYRELIEGFIRKLNGYADMRITTCATSTLVTGEYRPVMAMLTDMMEWSHAEQGKSVFVVKFIPGYDP